MEQEKRAEFERENPGALKQRERIFEGDDGSMIRRTENAGVVSEEKTYPDGRVDCTVTVNTVWAHASTEDYAEKIAVEILEAHGGQMTVDNFSKKFREEARRRGLNVDDFNVPNIGGSKNGGHNQ